MIRVARAPEPAALPAARKIALDGLRSALEANGALVRDDFPSEPYRAHDEILWKAQHSKCAYCELLVRRQGQDVEHYRPASRYWWLAYTWENLLFACQNCNRWGKNDEFPLENESMRLSAGNAPPGDERPLLVDPATEDGVDMIRFELRDWRPTPRDNSVRGANTIRILKLHANDLIELYDRHVAHLEHEIAGLRTATTKAKLAARHRSAWNEMLQRRLAAWSPFAGLTYDALDHFFPAALRARHELELLRPPVP